MHRGRKMKEFRPDCNFGRRMSKRLEKKQIKGRNYYTGIKLKYEGIKVAYQVDSCRGLQIVRKNAVTLIALREQIVTDSFDSFTLAIYMYVYMCVCNVNT